MTNNKDTYLEMIAKGITYDEMLKLGDEDFKNLISLREECNRAKLLEEMVDHEERTGSFRKTARKEISGPEQAVLDVFYKDKSTKTVELFDKVKNTIAENDKAGIDLVQEAIYAKAASDHVGLGDVMEKRRSNE